jgi:hypothetical protein
MDRPSLYLLAWIRQRPWMYFGTSEHPFTSLQAFLSGFGMGCNGEQVDRLPEEHRIQARWEGFREFVAEHYGIDHQMSTASWGVWIRERSQSEEEAFATFFSLFEKYQALSGLSWPEVKVNRGDDTKA